MFDYFKAQKYFIDQIWFVHEGIHYTGKGVLFWDPIDGFHFIANIERGALEIPFTKEFTSITFDTSTTIYLKLSGGSYAILPIYFLNEFELLHGHLFEKINRAIFIEPTSLPIKKYWYGSALLELSDSILFPDSVSVETKIGDSQPSRSFSRDGIHHVANNGQSVIGYQKEKKYLELNWSLPIDSWTKTECWEYAKGLQYSISALAGQAIGLKFREVHRANRTIREVFVNKKPISLGIIFRPFDNDIIKREQIIDLASFFVRGQNKADIAKKILIQMADASQQLTSQGQELLLSTILEATLRSIYHCPFVLEKRKRSDPFNLNRYLKKFREEYLQSSQDTQRSWKKVTSTVAASYRQLRHRNAHPDWLSTKEGNYSKDELERVTNNLILLSRFYGYMIMGLANLEIREPVFPLPIAEWKPMLTMSIGKSPKEQG